MIFSVIVTFEAADTFTAGAVAVDISEQLNDNLNQPVSVSSVAEVVPLVQFDEE